MANYDSLKQTIDDNITTNGNQEITGSILNSVLNEMVDVLGESVANGNDGSLTLRTTDNNVYLDVADADITLDTIAYENLTYRQIFETNNIISFGAGFENGNYGTYTASAGSPSVTTEEADSGVYSLKVSGTSSQQIKSPGTAYGRTWFASRVKITSYTSGYCGVQYGVGGSTNHDGGVSGVTNGWVTKVARKDDTNSYNIFIGSFLSASLTGYVDTPVVVPDSIFTNVPGESAFTALYNTYCAIKRGDDLSGERTIQLATIEEVTEPTADECMTAFMTAMANKMTQIGATGATFLDPSGLTSSGSSATANDIMQILIHAAGIRGIAEKWGKKSYDMTITGDNARTESITTSVASSTYDETAHPILGGKTGTITASGNVNYNLAWIARIGEEECACVLMGDSTDTRRWTDAEAIADYLDTIISGGSATLSINAPCALAVKLPPHPIMYDGISLTALASKNPTTSRIPASLTKLATLVTAYDYIYDESELVTIVSTDVIGGSGNNIAEGDIVSVRDLIYDMLLPSSNNAATALARLVGKKILGY